MWLWVDDIRKPPTSEWTWVRTCRDALGILRYNRIDVLSLDHDLGNGETTRPIVLYMCETGNWPRDVRVHSANPVGVEWLKGMIERYKDA